MLGKTKRKITDPRRPLPRPERPKIPLAMLIRMFLIGSIAVVASVWAIWRHYTVPRAPLLVPTPSASEIEVEPAP